MSRITMRCVSRQSSVTFQPVLVLIYLSVVASNPDPVTEGNANYDEIHYINVSHACVFPFSRSETPTCVFFFVLALQALTPVLTSGGFPAHFIVDQSRSGVQNIRGAWDDWCNVKGAGFGMRPTLDTGSPLVDAVVWVKPGGESDGTSNTSSPWYDPHCGLVCVPRPTRLLQWPFLTFGLVVMRPLMLLKLGLGSKCVCGRETCLFLCSSVF